MQRERPSRFPPPYGTAEDARPPTVDMPIQ
jgi:hypothetical protein